MKILLISHFWHTNSNHSKSSGYERVAYYLSKKHKVDLLTCGKENKTININDNFSLITRKTPNTNFFFEKRIFLSYHSIKLKNSYDIVHSLYSDTALLTGFKFPTIITEHVVKELDKSDLWLRYKSLLQGLIYKKVKLVIAVSKNLKPILEKKYGLKNKVIVIPHGVDIDVFYPRKIDEKLLVKKNKLLKAYQYLCFSCGIQGIDSKVFLSIAKKFPQILFVVAGREEKTDLSNVLNTGDISEEKLIEYYSLSDFCFKPLRFATANNGILEAMAMGKPIITNKIDGINEYLDNSCAYLTSSPDGFTKLFKGAMNNIGEAKIKGMNGRKKAVEKFSWQNIAGQTINVYERFINHKL